MMRGIGKGDDGWLLAYEQLLDLHIEKSATYGVDSDRLANFTKVAKATGHPAERYVLERIIEKAARALHMIDAGKGVDVSEYPDLASLGLCAEALRKRRVPNPYLAEVLSRKQ